MKCVRCGHDSKFKDRSNRTCPSCKGRFAFEPQSDDKFTDLGFRNAIDAVSGNGSVRFLPDHVYYQLNRRPGWRVPLVVAAVLGTIGGAAGFLFGGTPVLAIGFALLFASFALLCGWLYLRSDVASLVTLPRSTFDAAWRRWSEVHGLPGGVVPPNRRLGTARPAALEAELLD